MTITTYYFSHDYNARADMKIKRLISKHGMTGYGIYWALVEDLYQNSNALPMDYECISYDLLSEATLVKSIINDFDLFELGVNTFSSNSIKKRLEFRNLRSEKARMAAITRWDTKGLDDAMRTQCDSSAIKDSKKKERKEHNNGIPSLEEFIDYGIGNGPDIDTNSLELKYKSWLENGWKDGHNKPIKNWKSKLLNTIPYLNKVEKKNNPVVNKVKKL